MPLQPRRSLADDERAKPIHWIPIELDELARSLTVGRWTTFPGVVSTPRLRPEPGGGLPDEVDVLRCGEEAMSNRVVHSPVVDLGTLPIEIQPVRKGGLNPEQVGAALARKDHQILELRQKLDVERERTAMAMGTLAQWYTWHRDNWLGPVPPEHLQAPQSPGDQPTQRLPQPRPLPHGEVLR